MMNYIRTENKIIKAKKNKWNELVDKQGKYISEFEIIAQADTIEELCDEFVMVERNSKPRIFTTLKGAINNKIYDDEDIYGAIWTDKGLIYVAKMNEKGELELL